MKTYSRPILAVFIVILLCLTPAYGRRNKGNKKGDKSARPGPKLLRLACELTAADGTVRRKHCGCGDEEPVPCDVGPLDLPRYDVTSAKYCNVPVDLRTRNPFKGVLKSACLIEGAGADADQLFKYHPCKQTEDGEDVPCDLGPLPVVIDGVNAHAFFCNKDSKINLDKIDDQATCVQLDPSNKERKGKKDGNKEKKKGKKGKGRKGNKGKDKDKKGDKKGEGGRKRKGRDEGDDLE